ncbi:MAG TPA: 16S rRNA (cytosine(1402)-N(4))-methyltransferase RsmH [Polyangiaceae bacterium]|nr:16S rRNA (cytosine(1402)-N(4))-methyltransferase RsmH [Polyangiaceae bacterium]
MPAFEPPPDFHHLTVLRVETISALALASGGVYVDVTLGGGGHTEAILRAHPGVRVIAFDRDPNAIRAAGARLAEFADRITLVQSRFSRIEQELERLGQRQIDGLIADLGVSSPQLDEAERGMSFRREGPLDMRMDPTDGETAADLLVRLSQDELADVIYTLGEERRSRRIARCIKQALDAGELSTTTDLRRAIVRAVGPRRVGGIDPATRTFQALRLAVNRELEELGTLLSALPRVIRPGGHAALISFHSLEDRLVKRAFLERDAWERLSKKPVIASEIEQHDNPRSRSAKLRVARRQPPTLREEVYEEFDSDD